MYGAQLQAAKALMGIAKYTEAVDALIKGKVLLGIRNIRAKGPEHASEFVNKAFEELSFKKARRGWGTGCEGGFGASFSRPGVHCGRGHRGAASGRGCAPCPHAASKCLPWGLPRWTHTELTGFRPSLPDEAEVSPLHLPPS